MAKACNFGFPGGLGIKTFQYIARNSYGVELDADRCTELKKLWIESFPEMLFHLKPPKDPKRRRGGADEDEDDKYLARTLSGRIRANAAYCSACNYPFQGLSSDGARVALWYMLLEGFHTVNFVHDETITELDWVQGVHDKIARIDQLMVAGMQQVIKHVEIRVEGALMTRWYKEAQPVHDTQGNLTIWEP